MTTSLYEELKKQRISLYQAAREKATSLDSSVPFDSEIKNWPPEYNSQKNKTEGVGFRLSGNIVWNKCYLFEFELVRLISKLQ